MDSESDELSQKRPGEPRLHTQAIPTAERRLVKAFADHSPRELVMLQFEVPRLVGVGVNGGLGAFVKRREQLIGWIEQANAKQFKELPPKTSPIEALLSLEGHLEVLAPVADGEALSGFHRALEEPLPAHDEGETVVLPAGVEAAHFVIKVVLLVFERLRAADVAKHHLREGGGDDVAIPTSETHWGLAPVVNSKGGQTAGGVRALEAKLGRRAESECG